MNENKFRDKLTPLRLLLTDCDGVLTDGSVYYSAAGEAMKRFNIRDGMGVERLRFAGVDVGIITGERSPSLAQRAAKLKIDELHLGVKDKVKVFEALRERRGLRPREVGYIGDDANDLALMDMVGFAACPADALPFVQACVDYVCDSDGGRGAFREVAELIIAHSGLDPLTLKPTTPTEVR
jgi:3-deoxy-D-manno-octulosonate 8-phosphate phosphatase (KDO 8-P phosphatase)